MKSHPISLAISIILSVTSLTSVAQPLDHDVKQNIAVPLPVDHGKAVKNKPALKNADKAREAQEFKEMQEIHATLQSMRQAQQTRGQGNNPITKTPFGDSGIDTSLSDPLHKNESNNSKPLTGKALQDCMHSGNPGVNCFHVDHQQNNTMSTYQVNPLNGLGEGNNQSRGGTPPTGTMGPSSPAENNSTTTNNSDGSENNKETGPSAEEFDHGRESSAAAIEVQTDMRIESQGGKEPPKGDPGADGYPEPVANQKPHLVRDYNSQPGVNGGMVGSLNTTIQGCRPDGGSCKKTQGATVKDKISKPGPDQEDTSSTSGGFAGPQIELRTSAVSNPDENHSANGRQGSGIVPQPSSGGAGGSEGGFGSTPH